MPSRRSEPKPSTSPLKEPGKLTKKGKETSVTDSLLNKERRDSRAKQLFKDLESELVDLDAGRHIIIRGKHQPTATVLAKQSKEGSILPSSKKTAAQILNQEQTLLPATSLGRDMSVASKLSKFYQHLKSELANLVLSFHQVRFWLVKNQNRWLKPLVVIGILELSVILSYIGSTLQLEYLLIFVCGIGVVPLFMVQPILGVILTLMGGMFIPFSGPSGLNLAILGAAILLGFWFLDMFIRQRRFKLVISSTMLPALIFMFISLLAFFVGLLPFFAFAQHAPLDAQLGGLIIFVLSIGTFLMVANRIDDLRWLEVLTWTFIALGAFYVIGRLIEWGDIDHIYQKGFSTGSMFWTWLVALTFSQVVYNQRLKPFLRIILLGLIFAIFFVAYAQLGSWKSGWIPSLAAVTIILLLRFRKVAFALIPLVIISTIFLSNQTIATEDYSWGTRLDAWKIVLDIAKVNPILGLGFANYYWYTPLFSIRGWFVNFNSHSQYIDLIAQTGLLGMGCFLWLFWEIGRVGWKLRDKVPKGFPRAYVYGVLGGLVGTLVAAALVDWVLPFVYNIGLSGFRASILAWVFLGGLVYLEQLNRCQKQTT